LTENAGVNNDGWVFGESIDYRNVINLRKHIYITYTVRYTIPFLPPDALQCKARYCCRMSSVSLSV